MADANKAPAKQPPSQPVSPVQDEGLDKTGDSGSTMTATWTPREQRLVGEVKILRRHVLGMLEAIDKALVILGVKV